MNCFLHQHIIMLPFFWWNCISLLMLHLVAPSPKVHLFDPLERNETKSSSCHSGLLEDVDRLFLFGMATNLSHNSLYSPEVEFHRRIFVTSRWITVCKMDLNKCTGDNKTECGCEQLGNDRYTFHLNMTANLLMSRSLYRLFWIDQSGLQKTSESQKMPIVYRPETETVWSLQKLQVLNRSGKCEIPIQPNKHIIYCVRYLQKPFSVRIISWNIRKNEIGSTELISQICVATSSFTESGGGILAFTEFTGCQRQKTRYCSVIAKKSPHACKKEEKQKGSVNLTVENHAIDLSEEICSFNVTEDVNVSMTVCIQETQPPYNLTIVLGDHVKELTNFSQDCVSLYHTPLAATFQPNYQFIFIDRCQNNVTLICTAILGGAGVDDGTSKKGGDNRYFAIVILGIIIIALLSVMCLTVASLLFLSKKWQGTEEDAAMENDEGDALEGIFFDAVEYEATKVSEPKYSLVGSQVDSIKSPSTHASEPTSQLTSISEEN